MLNWLNSFFDSVLGWSFNVSPLFGMIFVTVIMTVITTLIYKYATDQKALKIHREEMKKIQKKMKESRDDPKKAMKLQKEMWSKSKGSFKQSLKPMLITFIPVILFFSWLGATLVFAPLLPGAVVNTTMSFHDASGFASLDVPEGVELLSDSEQEILDNKATWNFKAIEGDYIFNYVYENSSISKNVLVTESQGYEEPLTVFETGNIKSLSVEHKELKILDLFGWEIGWFGTYIIFTLIFSFVFRKMFKVY